MIVAPDSVAGLVTLRTHRRARLWTATRADGTVLRLTDHHVAIVSGGQTFAPGGWAATARETSGGMGPAELDLEGPVVASVGVTLADLRVDRWREAELLEQVVDFRFPWAGVLRTYRWWVDSATWSVERFRFRCEDVLRFLHRRKAALVGRTCRYDLGDARCTFNLALVTDNGGAVGSVTSRQVFTTSAGTLPNSKGVDWYADGRIYWQTGANAGKVSQVRSHPDSATGAYVFTLHQATAAASVAGDTFNAEAGCRKRFAEDCRDKFAAITAGHEKNFGGEPHMPNTDVAIKPQYQK